MPRSSARRGQVEPLAALAALVVLCAALTTYAVAYRDAIPDGRDRDPAEPALARTFAAAAPDAAVRPGRLADAAAAAVPTGYRLNVTVTAGDRRWTAGPAPPADAASASRSAPVRVGPGRVEPGRLRVEVWT